VNLKYTQLAKSGEIPVQGSWLLVQGDEEFLKRGLLERLRGQLLSTEDAFNFDQLDVRDRWEGIAETAEQAKRDRLPTRADRILNLAQALPFLGGGRLLLVRGIDLLATDGQKKLAAALATVPPMNHVLLVTSEAGAGKKATKLVADLLKGIEKVGVVYDCSALTENDAKAWITTTLADWGQTIEPAALQLLVTRAGTELRRLQIEVDKLSVMVSDRGRIRAQDVEMMTPKLAEESVFHLADAVAGRNAAQALTMLRDLLEGQLESPYRIFPMIVRQFRLIWQTKVLLDAGWKPRMSPADFPTAVALLPEQNAVGQIAGWMAPKLAESARQFSWEQLTTAYTALLECDMAGKAIEGVPRQELDIALELLCARLCYTPRAKYR